jgi:hypothetical protein
MNNGKLKIEKNAEGMDCHIDGPTEKAAIVRDAIFYAMKEMDVNGDEVLPVLGEAVVEFLIVIAKACDEDELELIRCFGEGIMTAEVELKKEK